MADPAVGSDLHGRQAGDVIHVTGTLKGKAVERDVRVDSAPWYQVFGPLLDELLPEGAAQQEFWVVDPGDLAPHKMQVKRAGPERVTIKGIAVDTSQDSLFSRRRACPVLGRRLLVPAERRHVRELPPSRVRRNHPHDDRGPHPVGTRLPLSRYIGFAASPARHCGFRPNWQRWCKNGRFPQCHDSLLRAGRWRGGGRVGRAGRNAIPHQPAVAATGISRGRSGRPR